MGHEQYRRVLPVQLLLKWQQNALHIFDELLFLFFIKVMLLLALPRVRLGPDLVICILPHLDILLTQVRSFCCYWWRLLLVVRLLFFRQNFHVIMPVNRMMIEKLTKRHHRRELQLFPKTPAHQMNKYPPIILLWKHLLLQHLMPRLYVLERRPLFFKTWLISLCCRLYCQVFELL